MKPNPFAALGGSRKTIVAVAGLAVLAAIYFGPGEWQQKSAALVGVSGIVMKFLGAIADEDVSKNKALAASSSKPEGIQ